MDRLIHNTTYYVVRSTLYPPHGSGGEFIIRSVTRGKKACKIKGLRSHEICHSAVTPGHAVVFLG